MVRDNVVPARTAELRRSWAPLVGATIGVAVGLGSLPLYSNSAVFVALEKQNGWSASSVALVFLIANLAMAAVGPFWGRILDRLGSRRPVFVGGVVLAASYFALAIVPDNFPLYVITQVVAYVGATATAVIGYARAITLGFSRMRGLAFGIMNTGPALIAFLLPAITAAVIGGAGLRAGFALLGIIALVGTAIAALLIPRTTASDRVTMAEEVAATPVRPSPRLILVMLAFFLAAMATIGLIEEMFALLLKTGTEQSVVIWLLSSIGLAMLVIRLVIGALLDVVPAKWVAVGAFGIVTLGMLALVVFGPAAAVFATLTLGLALGSETDIMPMLISRLFPRAQFGRVMGYVGMAFGVGVAIGPFLLALVLDHTATAAPTVLVAVAILAVAAVLFGLLPVDRPVRSHERDESSDAASTTPTPASADAN